MIKTTTTTKNKMYNITRMATINQIKMMISTVTFWKRYFILSMNPTLKVLFHHLKSNYFNTNVSCSSPLSLSKET